MKKKALIAAVAAALILVAVAVRVRRKGSGSHGVGGGDPDETLRETYPEGDTITLPCLHGRSEDVLSAFFGPVTDPSGVAIPEVDVTLNAAKALARGDLGVSSAALLGPGWATPREKAAAGEEKNAAPVALRLTYRCRIDGPSVVGRLRAALRGRRRMYAARGHFVPVPELLCGAEPPPEYAIDRTGRGAANTVVWEPFTDRRSVAGATVAADAAAAAAVGPTIRLAPTPLDRELGTPAGGRALTRLAALTRRSAPPASASGTSCARALSDIDSDLLFNDGLPDTSGLCDAAPYARRPPTGSLRLGLGSISQDFRFQPGQEQRLPGGDAQPAPGTFAGGITFGALAPDVFAPGGAWDAQQVKSFGDGHLMSGRRYPVARLITASE